MTENQNRNISETIKLKLGNDCSSSVPILPNKVEWIYWSCIQVETYRGINFPIRGGEYFKYIWPVRFWLISGPFVRVIFSADCITRECRGRGDGALSLFLITNLNDFTRKKWHALMFLWDPFMYRGEKETLDGLSSSNANKNHNIILVFYNPFYPVFSCFMFLSCLAQMI